MNKNCVFSVFLALSLILTGLSAGYAQEEPSQTPFQVLGHVEDVIYGQTQNGGLIVRLGNVEKDLFGRELPGSIAERQQALLNFIEEGTMGQPSFLFKLGVAEWAVSQKSGPTEAATVRVANLEGLLEGRSDPERPLAMRLERLLTLLLPDGVTSVEADVPMGTVFKVELGQTLSPATAKADDPISLKLKQNFILDGVLVAPEGSLVRGHVASVKPPRSFGRKAEINLAFDNLVPLGPDKIPVYLGEHAKEAGKGDKDVMAAAGASFLGLVVLGPVGLATGFLVRGSADDLPEGTLLYLETMESSRVQGYPVPAGLKGFMDQGIDVPASADSGEGEMSDA